MPRKPTTRTEAKPASDGLGEYRHLDDLTADDYHAALRVRFEKKGEECEPFGSTVALLSGKSGKNMEVIQLHNVDAELVDKLSGVLAFMESVSLEATPRRPTLLVPGDPSVDASALKGIWKDTDVTLETIRKKAWKGKD